MKRIGLGLVVLAVLFCVAALPHLLISTIRIVRAQNPTLTPTQFSVGTGTHLNCTLVASETTYCFASDGVWQSLAGGAYTPLGGVGPVGPAGPQGIPGPQGPPGVNGVTSVNGKTGVVTIGATTTLQ